MAVINTKPIINNQSQPIRTTAGSGSSTKGLGYHMVNNALQSIVYHSNYPEEALARAQANYNTDRMARLYVDTYNKIIVGNQESNERIKAEGNPVISRLSDLGVGIGNVVASAPATLYGITQGNNIKKNAGRDEIVNEIIPSLVTGIETDPSSTITQIAGSIGAGVLTGKIGSSIIKGNKLPTSKVDAGSTTKGTVKLPKTVYKYDIPDTYYAKSKTGTTAKSITSATEGNTATTINLPKYEAPTTNTAINTVSNKVKSSTTSKSSTATLPTALQTSQPRNILANSKLATAKTASNINEIQPVGTIIIGNKKTSSNLRSLNNQNLYSTIEPVGTIISKNRTTGLLPGTTQTKPIITPRYTIRGVKEIYGDRVSLPSEKAIKKVQRDIDTGNLSKSEKSFIENRRKYNMSELEDAESLYYRRQSVEQFDRLDKKHISDQGYDLSVVEPLDTIIIETIPTRTKNINSLNLTSEIKPIGTLKEIKPPKYIIRGTKEIYGDKVSLPSEKAIKKVQRDIDTGNLSKSEKAFIQNRRKNHLPKTEDAEALYTRRQSVEQFDRLDKKHTAEKSKGKAKPYGYIDGKPVTKAEWFARTDAEVVKYRQEKPSIRQKNLEIWESHNGKASTQDRALILGTGKTKKAYGYIDGKPVTKAEWVARTDAEVVKYRQEKPSIRQQNLIIWEAHNGKADLPDRIRILGSDKADRPIWYAEDTPRSERSSTGSNYTGAGNSGNIGMSSNGMMYATRSTGTTKQKPVYVIDIKPIEITESKPKPTPTQPKTSQQSTTKRHTNTSTGNGLGTSIVVSTMGIGTNRTTKKSSTSETIIYDTTTTGDDTLVSNIPSTTDTVNEIVSNNDTNDTNDTNTGNDNTTDGNSNSTTRRIISAVIGATTATPKHTVKQTPTQTQKPTQKQILKRISKTEPNRKKKRRTKNDIHKSLLTKHPKTKKPRKYIQIVNYIPWLEEEEETAKKWYMVDAKLMRTSKKISAKAKKLIDTYNKSAKAYNAVRKSLLKQIRVAGKTEAGKKAATKLRMLYRAVKANRKAVMIEMKKSK